MTNGPQRLALVVDPDPGAAAALGPALRREGYQLRIARDGARALQLAMARVPDVVLVDDATPVVAPRTLIRILRSNPRTAAVPILYSAADPERLPEGATAFVHKPLEANELLAAIRKLIASAEETASRGQERVEGSLAQLPLPDVLQLLGNNRRSGRLVISGDALRGELVFRDGELVDAACDGVVGEKLLFRLLTLRDGRFVFRPGDPGVNRRIERPLTELLLDGLAHADELATLAAQLPDRDAVLALAPRGEGTEELLEVVGVVEDELRSLLSEPHPLALLLDRSSASDLETSRAVLRLLASGEVRVAEPRAEAVEDSVPILSPAGAHALRARLRQGPISGTAIGKVVVAGGDASARRRLLGRVAALAGYRAVPAPGAEFGTVGAFDLADLRLDLVLLPQDPLLAPLAAALSAGALVTLVLGCAPGDEGYVDPDPVVALRALLARAATRVRAS